MGCQEVSGVVHNTRLCTTGQNEASREEKTKTNCRPGRSGRPEKMPFPESPRSKKEKNRRSENPQGLLRREVLPFGERWEPLQRKKNAALGGYLGVRKAKTNLKKKKKLEDAGE